jgi:myo-inositol 2-dehydrogenase / D-chiro-inositol 1-dehydrogenase
MTADPLGVGFVGAGPVTQAIHLPTLARLTELFTVTHVTDIADEIAASVAARVAARVGARSSTSSTAAASMAGSSRPTAQRSSKEK